MSTSKKSTKSSTAKMGRPKDSVERTTVSFRVPKAVEDAIANLAASETTKTPGRTVKASDLYNQAIAEMLLKRGVRIPGYNVAA